MYIYPKTEARLSDDGLALFVGRPGNDGIEFAYRVRASGIWAWYPQEGEWRRVANDMDELDRNWRSSSMTV